MPTSLIPKTLIFHDSKQDATDAADFMDSNLPRPLKNRGIVKHYHSDMSVEYLQQTFEDFSDVNGTCRVLHSTAGAATVGLDIQGVQIVVQYGICKNMAEMIQRAGHAVRDPNLTGLFLVMVETWAIELGLGNSNDKAEANRDKPYAGLVKMNSSKQDRTSIASLQFVQSKTCLREFFAGYLGDNSPEDRLELLEQLTEWRNEVHQQDLFYPITWIIDDDGLELVSKTHPTKLQSFEDLIKLLAETEDWAKHFGVKMFDIISQFKPSQSSESSTCERPAKRGKHTVGTVTFMTVQTPETFATMM
ncbi:hypothetical protein J3R83DRAFT_13749 [Lanmaoa asiatica]|nr:hypothetical protein J3R83DRAFT_13749 [Lanmaoa asiatica]